MFQDISLSDLLALQEQKTHTLIDVRSPKEFNEATIPGSINIPIFNDEERAEVGTIYKQQGVEAAKERGLELFSQKLPAFIAAFKEIETPMTVFCWRGGMRSKTAATVLGLMGIRANRLTGGIRTYRQWVVQELENQPFQPKLFVLNGYTGSGKTAILQRLAEHGYPVIDLERMAGHRGSIFGQIGLEPSNQKKFDSLLVSELRRYQNESFVFIEGESKRIGKVYLPSFLNEKKEKSTQFFLDLPVEERVRNILDDYQPWKYPERFKEAFQFIKKRIHTPVSKQIETALEEQDFSIAIQLLLEYYYDPKYEYSTHHYSDEQKVIIEAANVDEAFQKIVQTLKEQGYGLKANRL
ncbi:tRNA 2-selenouridine(34) synthase MnmH [Pseudobacillus wudalianchiensis]|uniref:tRNA 2-selenouridine(34) synthase MnmH n=1 Tax=Pseudobacillus wudalianchiensis TaxID=1743143 RepID=A0A1B9B733_9BACI|nr:tRNA 2-selenouridine(34) synthase MnmH [Bacillus wudalianchiensis]OCA91873.1 tRNA 2-selenouridine(34) synthase MnmH [Bacillus wudalianchiensis]